MHATLTTLATKEQRRQALSFGVPGSGSCGFGSSAPVVGSYAPVVGSSAAAMAEVRILDPQAWRKHNPVGVAP